MRFYTAGRDWESGISWGEAGEPPLPATPFLVDTEGVVQTCVSAASGVTATWLPILAFVREGPSFKEIPDEPWGPLWADESPPLTLGPDS